jgi:hypothetical protein
LLTEVVFITVLKNKLALPGFTKFEIAEFLAFSDQLKVQVAPAANVTTALIVKASKQESVPVPPHDVHVLFVTV